MFLLYVKIESGNLSDIFSSVTSSAASTSGTNRPKKKGKVTKDKSIISKVYLCTIYSSSLLETTLLYNVSLHIYYAVVESYQKKP